MASVVAPASDRHHESFETRSARAPQEDQQVSLPQKISFALRNALARGGTSSLRFQIVTLSLAILVLWLGVALAGMIHHAKTRIAAEVEASMALAHALVETALAGMAETADPAASLAEFGRRLPHARHVRMAVAGAASSAALAGLHASPETESPAPQWFVSLIAAKPALEAVQLGIAGRRFGQVFIVPNPDDEIHEIWQEFCFLAAICAALVGAIIGSISWMIGRALRPIRVLASGLEHLEQGDFTISVEPIRVSELARIGEKFNSLARSLDHTLADNRMLCHKLMSLRESERKHIAQELHDELGSCLFALRAETSCIVASAAKSPPATDDILERARSIHDLVHSVQQINRRILETLRPIALKEIGLAAALRDLVDTWQTHHPTTNWSLELREDDVAALDETVSLVVYRVVQECLTNIARHAQSTTAEISVRREEGQLPCAARLRVVVRDNGRGISGTQRSGLGLLGIRERVRELGGQVAIEAGPGRGVVVDADIPVAAATGAS
jgi:two-component system, NarL family, sensor histidine kinase UhpB